MRTFLIACTATAALALTACVGQPTQRGDSTAVAPTTTTAPAPAASCGGGGGASCGAGGKACG